MTPLPSHYPSQKADTVAYKRGAIAPYKGVTYGLRKGFKGTVTASQYILSNVVSKRENRVSQ